MPHRPLHLLAAATLAAFILAGCATPPPPQTIAATAAATPQLSTLAKLVGEAGLADTLSGPGPFTVFAPTDEAFKAVPAKTLEALGKDKAMLRSVLNYHVVAGRMAAAEIKNGPLKSVQGANLALSKSGSFVTVDDAVVTTADVAASNGVVHIVDRVMLPPTK